MRLIAKREYLVGQVADLGHRMDACRLMHCGPGLVRAESRDRWRQNESRDSTGH